MNHRSRVNVRHLEKPVIRTPRRPSEAPSVAVLEESDRHQPDRCSSCQRVHPFNRSVELIAHAVSPPSRRRAITLRRAGSGMLFESVAHVLRSAAD